MSESGRDGDFGLPLERTLRAQIATLSTTISEKDAALVKANMEIEELRQQVAQLQLPNCKSTLSAAVGAAGSATQSHSSAHSVSTLMPFFLTPTEMAFFEKVVKTTVVRDNRGNIQWELVAREFANAANNDTIFARSKDRLESTYKNKTKQSKEQLNGAKANVAVSASADTNQGPAIVPPVPPVGSSSSTSVAIALSATTTTTTTTNSSQLTTPTIRLKSDTPFTDTERSMIKQWGLDMKKSTPPRDVTDRYLFNQHFQYFYTTLGFARRGSELKNVWDSWWKDHKKNFNR
jgi:hypothetical protein